MARGKKVKTGGKSRGIPRSSNQTNSRSPKSPRARFAGNFSEEATFTLRDAARTERGSASWNSIVKLRHQSIGFVRSVDGAPVIPPEVTQDDDRDEGDDRNETDLPTISNEAVEDVEAFVSDAYPAVLGERPSSPVPLVFTPMTATIRSRRSISPAVSNSSDEIVLFRGRTQPRRRSVARKAPHPPAIPHSQPTTIPSDPRKVSATRKSNDPGSSRLNTHPVSRRHSGARNEMRPDRDISGMAKDAWLDPFLKTRRKSKQRRVKLESSDDEVDSVLDDYVANMIENGTGDEMGDVTALADEQPTDHDGWASCDIEDFDDMSTSDEVLEVLQQVLSKRHRPSGPQYLVVWDGQSVDEARWIPASSLTMEGAAVLIESFEMAEKDVPEYPQSSSADEESDSPEVDGNDASDNDDSGDESEDFEDDRDLIERRSARLSDEKLARLLAKQEEYGLGSDELVLFDEMFADDGEAEDASDSGLQFAMQSGRRKGPRGRLVRLDFPGGFDDVMMIGDGDYGDFDVMDRERSSLGRGAKKQSDPLTWGLSDPDQAEDLRRIWAADRKTKKLKKLEREELRAQGLLGKKNKFKPDLKMKYNDGIDIEQLGQGLEAFLFSSHESRSLPPMDKRDRKVVHEIASAFGLKSLSKGSGRTRFPILQKTSRTIDFDDGLFARLRGSASRRFYPRMDRKSSTPIRASRGRGGGNGVMRADIGYREGEVVGATAPELAADNRGRAMLEKMGWTTGNALGALNNKGILQPIAHVVKNSRAGLG